MRARGVVKAALRRLRQALRPRDRDAPAARNGGGISFSGARRVKHRPCSDALTVHNSAAEGNKTARDACIIIAVCDRGAGVTWVGMEEVQTAKRAKAIGAGGRTILKIAVVSIAWWGC